MKTSRPCAGMAPLSRARNASIGPIAVIFGLLWPAEGWSQTTSSRVLDPVLISPGTSPKTRPHGKKQSSSNVRSRRENRLVTSRDGSDVLPPLSDHPLNLARVNVSGSRLNLTPMQTPASVEVVNAATIAERGQHDILAAVTQNVAGFTASPAPGNGGLSFSTRGFTGTNSVMTLYDGTLFYPAAGTLTFPFDTWSTDRIEVLRGPASVLYGAGAIGGVVNIIPKKPTTTPYNQAELSFDTNMTKRIAVDSGGPISPNVTYRINATGNISDGWVDRDKTSNVTVSAAVRAQVAENLAFTLSNDYGDRSPSRYFGTPVVNNAIDDALRFKNYNVLDSHIRYQDNWSQFKTEWDVADGVSVRNTLYYLTSQRHWRDAETYTWNPTTRMIDRSDYIEILHNQKQLGDRMDVTLKGHVLGFSNELVAGFDINRIDFAHTNNSPYGGASSVDPLAFYPGLFASPDPTTPAFRTLTNQYALFAEDRLKLSEQLAVVSGVRLDRSDITRTDYRYPTKSFETSLSGLSWRTGVVYNPTRDLAFYGQYSTAVDPVGTLITTSIAQKDFKLATGKQIEVGVKQTLWGGRVEWTIAGYQIVKNDLLTADPINPNVVRQVGQQSSRGVEASVGLVLNGGWRINANVALLRSKYDNYTQSVAGALVDYSGNVPVNVPQQVSNIWATWNFASNWSIDGGVQIVGKTYADSANTLSIPAYTVVNAGLRWKPDARTTVAVRLTNLLDKVYATSGDTGQWLLGAPRTAELSVNVKF